MPTATAFLPSDINAAVERVTTLPKRVGAVYLDGHKKTVATAISAGRKTSAQSLVVVRTLVEAETEVAGELTKTCTAVVRKIRPA